MKRISLWGLLYPTKCIFCRQLLPDHSQDICPQCQLDLPELQKSQRKIPFSCGCTALWRYDGIVRDSLLRFKFCRKRHYAKYYGQALALKLQSLNIPFDIITWTPVSAKRKFQRGYDQGQLLSQVLGQHLGIEVVKCLQKAKNNQPQSTLKDASQRRANVMGVYKPMHKSKFFGKRILLIDDIITTGATISECTKVLMMHGAKSVYCSAIAEATNHK